VLRRSWLEGNIDGTQIYQRERDCGSRRVFLALEGYNNKLLCTARQNISIYEGILRDKASLNPNQTNQDSILEPTRNKEVDQGSLERSGN
jgi:hypothetical protein